VNKQHTFQSAIKWAYFANWGEKGLSALFMVVLAAVLGPRDFGTVSLAVIYISFLQLFLDQGLALALIQTRDLKQQHLDTVFWFDLALSIVFVSLGILLRNPLARINHAPEAAIIIAALTPSILLEASAIVPISLLRRQMDFKSLSIRTNASMIAGGFVGIVLALTGFRVWALVAQQLTRDLVAAVLIWKLSSWRPCGGFSWKHFRQLLPFSTANFAGQLSTFADGQGSALVLGAMFGPMAVGLYRLGERITNTVITMSMASIQAVALPEFARLRDQPQELRRTALHCIRMSGTASLPALAAVAALAPTLMAVLGSRWIPAAGVLRILSVAAMVIIFSFFTGPFLQGIGRAREAALLEWVRVLPGLAALLIAGWLVHRSPPQTQVMGIAFARLAMGVLLITPLALTVLSRLCRISLHEYFAAALPSLATSASVAASIQLAAVLTRPFGWPPVTSLALQGSCGCLCGIPAMLWMHPSLRTRCARWMGRDPARLALMAEKS
jgi:PST family polysaccharide transporter